MKEQDSPQFNPENSALPLKGHVYCKILIESTQVKELIREKEPHLYAW